MTSIAQTWDKFLHYVWPTPDRALPSKEQMFNAQLNMQSQSNRIDEQVRSLAHDVGALRARNENIDGFYVRTVATALNERLDQRVASVNERITASIAEMTAAYRRMQETVDQALTEIRATQARIDKVLKGLRAAGEG